MKIIKYILYILLVLVIIAIVSIIIKNYKAEAPAQNGNNMTVTPISGSSKDTATNNKSIAEPREICYIYNTEARDSARLQMIFTGNGGSQVIGIFKYQASGKSPLIGPISGTAGPLDKQAMARNADLIWQTSKTTKEKLSVVFGDGSANPKSAVTPATLSLSQASCADSAVK